MTSHKNISRKTLLTLGLVLGVIGLSFVGWRVSASEQSQRLIERLNNSAPWQVERQGASSARSVKAVPLSNALSTSHPPAAQSPTIYSNLQNPFDVLFSNRRMASSFITDGSTSGTGTLGVGINIFHFGGVNETDANNFLVQLWSNTNGPLGNQPGALLATLTGNTDPDDTPVNTSAVYHYTGTVTLAPNTTYWVVNGTATNVNGYWPSFNRSQSPMVGADTDTMWTSFDSGTTWANINNSSSNRAAGDSLNMVVDFVSTAPPDGDNDGVADASDNCPTVANPGQENNDGDADGDACDPDDDNDGVADTNDAFPFNPNESVDTDGDGIGNNADTDDDNDGQSDADETACGSNPLNTASKAADLDGDGRPDCVDPDDDNDGVADTADNCPLVANASQANYDGDPQGDACDNDDDNDSVPDASDAFPKGSLLGTVVIAGCSSGVPNHVFANGASFNDLIAQCAASATNHGQFVSCVSALINQWKSAGLITGAQKGTIMSCASGAPIP